MTTTTETRIACFDSRYRLLLQRDHEGKWELPTENCLASRENFETTRPEEIRGTKSISLLLAGRFGEESPLSGQWMTVNQIEQLPSRELNPELTESLTLLKKNLHRVPYLGRRDHDYIFRFRTEKQRNRGVYREAGKHTKELYQGQLCEAIKEVKRVNERRSDSPALLPFGPVEYLLPSHFGFCLGVQNAIERAYETIVENPGKRIFMLSELIHNPFVNQDLARRGLRYLQTDKGVPCIDPKSGKPWWDLLTAEDIVIIPAFGATNEDKSRLVALGINFDSYDATCMLVEKVWKAAKTYGRKGYTVLIHGKSEHEETKATFSNTLPYAPCLVIRDIHQAEILAEIMTSEDPLRQQELWQRHFEDLASPGFDPGTDLRKIAVVNQTTLLRNETLGIIAHLEKRLTTAFGEDEAHRRLHSQSKGDTLCYATQVNQDALEKSLQEDLDYALVIGGKNSSNTAQLFRMCREKFGEHAFYIQSEENILSSSEILHCEMPYPKPPTAKTEMVTKPFLPMPLPQKTNILITGGASCPDGLIQQVINKINSLYPQEDLRSMEKVLADIDSENDR